jgi:hypothetical protein
MSDAISGLRSLHELCNHPSLASFHDDCKAVEAVYTRARISHVYSEMIDPTKTGARRIGYHKANSRFCRSSARQASWWVLSGAIRCRVEAWPRALQQRRCFRCCRSRQETSHRLPLYQEVKAPRLLSNRPSPGAQRPRGAIPASSPDERSDIRVTSRISLRSRGQRLLLRSQELSRTQDCADLCPR